MIRAVRCGFFFAFPEEKRLTKWQTFLCRKETENGQKSLKNAFCQLPEKQVSYSYQSLPKVLLKFY